MTMSRVLVTGAAGLLGRATVDALADEGIEVHALVRSKEQAFRADVEFHEVDLGAPLDARVLPERIDSVFHLSQAREFRDFPDAARRVFSINVASTAAFQPIPTMAVYAATKAAISTLANVMAKEFATLNITCNTLGITGIASDMLAQLPNKAARAFVLAHVEGWRYRQIGEELGVSERMVKRYIAQAMLHCALIRRGWSDARWA